MTRIAGPAASATRPSSRPPDQQVYERNSLILTIQLLTLVLLLLALLAHIA
jgi:hypothetical protein